MKVLLASDGYFPTTSGLATFTYELAKGLARRGHEAYVMAPSQSFRSTTYKQDGGVTVLGTNSVGIFVYQNFRVSHPLIARGTVKKYVKELNPDIIHIQNHFMIGKMLLSEAKEWGIPIMGTNHFMPDNLVDYLYLPKFLEERAKRFGWRQFDRVYNQLEIVTAPTETAAKLTQENALKKKVISISNGIDLERFNPKNDGRYLLGKYKIPKKPIILYVGRLDAEKKIDDVLRAMTTIRKKIDAHLVLVGPGQRADRFKKLAQELGIKRHVTFTGFLKERDLPNIYRIADVFVLAGVAELQGIVTMEAMASGLPVIAANAVATPELVQNGKNGYLFEPGDSRSLAKYAIKLLSNKALREKMGKKSLEIIQEHNIEKTIDQYEALYMELLRKKTSAL